MNFSQRGNILFLILLAVVLFAALAYAVTSSMRGGGKDASSEVATNAASAITNYGALVASTVQRLMLTNDCKDTLISFQNTVESGYTNYNSSPVTCRVFDPAGGALQWMNADVKWLDPYFANSPWGASFFYGKTFFPGNQAIGGVGTSSNGYASSTVDLLLEIPYVLDSVCKAINDQVGMPFPLYATHPTTGATLGMIDAAKAVGRFTSCYPGDCNYYPALRAQTNASAPAITPPTSFCMTGTWGSGNPESGKILNTYVHVLVPR